MASFARRLGTQPVPVIQPSAFTFSRVRAAPQPQSPSGERSSSSSDSGVEAPQELTFSGRRPVQCQSPVVPRVFDDYEDEDEEVQIDQVVVAVPYRLDRELREMERCERRMRKKEAERVERRLERQEDVRTRRGGERARTHSGRKNNAECAYEYQENSVPVLGIRRDAPDYGEGPGERFGENPIAGIGTEVGEKERPRFEYASFYGL